MRVCRPTMPLPLLRFCSFSLIFAARRVKKLKYQVAIAADILTS